MKEKQNAIKIRSRGKWEAVKNSSWSEMHVSSFGNRPGYVICYQNKNSEMVALASVIGQSFVSQNEIDANAKLIELCPDMALFIEKIQSLETTDKEFKNIIAEARELYQKMHF